MPNKILVKYSTVTIFHGGGVLDPSNLPPSSEIDRYVGGIVFLIIVKKFRFFAVYEY